MNAAPETVQTSVHERKRRKNLAVLLLVLGWCALIFMVTMAKLAHADENAPAPASKPFPNERVRHQAKIEQTEADFLATRTTHQKAIDDADSDDIPEPEKKPVATGGGDNPTLKFGVRDVSGQGPH